MSRYSLRLNQITNKKNIANSLESFGFHDVDLLGSSSYMSFSGSETNLKKFLQAHTEEIAECLKPSGPSPIKLQPEIVDCSHFDESNYNHYKDSAVTLNQMLADVELPANHTGEGVDIIVVSRGLPSNIGLNNQLKYVNWYYFADSLWEEDYPQFPNEPTALSPNLLLSVVGGQNNGWTTNANIHCIDYNRTQTTVGYYWPKIIENWHNSKPLLSNGNRRPTVVISPITMGSATANAVTNIKYVSENQIGPHVKSLNYRGVEHAFYNASGIINPSGQSVFDFFADYGIRLNSEVKYSTPSTTYKIGNIDSIPLSSFYTASAAFVDSMVQQSGIILIASAGNDGTRCVRSGDPDFNNSVLVVDNDTNTSGVYYYNRLPYPARAGISVGAVSESYTKQKSFSSNCGSAIDIYAPGEGVSAFNGVSWDIYSGTSLAACQVGGMVACYLSSLDLDNVDQVTQSGVKDWLQSNSTSTMKPNYVLDADSPSSLQADSSTNRKAFFPGASVKTTIATSQLPLFGRFGIALEIPKTTYADWSQNHLSLFNVDTSHSAVTYSANALRIFKNADSGFVYKNAGFVSKLDYEPNFPYSLGKRFCSINADSVLDKGSIERLQIQLELTLQHDLQWSATGPTVPPPQWGSGGVVVFSSSDSNVDNCYLVRVVRDPKFLYDLPLPVQQLVNYGTPGISTYYKNDQSVLRSHYPKGRLQIVRVVNGVETVLESKDLSRYWDGQWAFPSDAGQPPENNFDIVASNEGYALASRAFIDVEVERRANNQISIRAVPWGYLRSNWDIDSKVTSVVTDSFSHNTGYLGLCYEAPNISTGDIWPMHCSFNRLMLATIDY